MEFDGLHLTPDNFWRLCSNIDQDINPSTELNENEEAGGDGGDYTWQQQDEDEERNKAEEVRCVWN